MSETGEGLRIALNDLNSWLDASQSMRFTHSTICKVIFRHWLQMTLEIRRNRRDGRGEYLVLSVCKIYNDLKTDEGSMQPVKGPQKKSIDVKAGVVLRKTCDTSPCSGVSLEEQDPVLKTKWKKRQKKQKRHNGRRGMFPLLLSTVWQRITWPGSKTMPDQEAENKGFQQENPQNAGLMIDR